MVIWFLGKSASGKTFLGEKLYNALKVNYPNIVYLDGDMLRVTIEKLEYDLIKRIVDDIRLLRTQPHYQKLSDEDILKDMFTKAEGEIV